MSSARSTTSSDGPQSTSRQGSSRHKRVVTTPSWARRLPPDELELLDDDSPSPPVPSSSSPRRPSQPLRRSLSCVVRDVKNADARPSTSSAGAPLLRDVNSEGSWAGLATPLAPVHSNSELRRSQMSAPGGGADRWWTFTLPSKYMDKVHGYVHGEEGDKGKDRQRDEGDSSGDELPIGRRSMKEAKRATMDAEKHEHSRSMSMRLTPSNIFSLNQTQTPGWSSPWTPFHRDENALYNQDPFTIAQAAAQQQTKTTRFESFILHNPFSPLLFRTCNLVLNGCTLGIASHIRLQEQKAGVIGVIGSSTLFAICVSPLAIVHIFITLYIEYFGPPIGIWNVRTKMFHTLTELIFICLWSSILSLAMDDLFTSSLACTTYTPYARYNTAPPVVGSSAVDGTLADSICGQQIAQVVFIFLSVMLYIAVLVVSLFRIFAKVSRKT